MNVLAEQAQGGNPIVSLMPLILIAVAFYFFLIRPQSKRRREQMELQNSVEPGSRVLTTNGMYATVAEVDDDGVTLEIAPGVEARFVKQAIMQVIKDDVEDDDDADDDETELAETDAADETAKADAADEVDEVDLAKSGDKAVKKP
ncbi:preprotein translocase subunit YajC [Actinomadura craniellae]|uniref:Preprotein translocase subunit YajC n=2 Tax=Actinomadura craniellae TaxID=2231787 RepID=A0A365HDZ1_9ACTN|nr:preprotein translocase subunit YajC [Actinomadura craniellae]